MQEGIYCPRQDSKRLGGAEMYFGNVSPEHQYTFVAIGLKKHLEKCFRTREDANRYMYKVCAKYKLHIVEVYDDKHYKTYKCNDGVKIYISRF